MGGRLSHAAAPWGLSPGLGHPLSHWQRPHCPDGGLEASRAPGEPGSARLAAVPGVAFITEGQAFSVCLIYINVSVTSDAKFSHQEASKHI